MNEQPQMMPPEPYRQRSREEAFGPPLGTQWWGLSPRYRWHRRISALAVAVLVGPVGALVVSRSAGGVGVLLWSVVVLLGLAVAWVAAEQEYRAWGFLERADDLVITSGVFGRRIVVVPYGRMQFVDVTSGPLEQVLGLATVRLHTAAATTDARVPGLPTAVADQLRDRLARRGDEGQGL
ncbi:PH domain-containing protein [Actinocorallia sp. A-T 12471]|uniref:PH domain-containing protein n=1 Tax=Actinocorallia sp. A-T 12471 TaxID=3089813 RepID=UPI0029CDE812|nr:PH domain-containing protein [Actinocorallia sp. A-T 12471]MDX6741815.1 PH domain-containing protein [Actinocorallia sp. A-T 12471]